MSETARNMWRMAYAALVKWWPQNQWFPPRGGSESLLCEAHMCGDRETNRHRSQCYLLLEGPYG